jgi:hypothetical protein
MKRNVAKILSIIGNGIRKALLAGACIFWILVSSGFGGEADYQGHPAAYWLAQWTRDERDGPFVPESDKAFHAMGTNALPFLLEVLRHKPSPGAEEVHKLYEEARKLRGQPGEQGVLKAARSAAEQEFQQERQSVKAAALIGRLGREGAPAIPGLMRIMNDLTIGGEFQDEVQSALMEIVRELENGGHVRPMDWLNLLGEIGPSANPALPALEKRLATAYSVSERRDIAIAIRKIDPQEAAKLGLPGSLGLP